MTRSPGRRGRPGGRHQGRDLGLADPVGRGRERLRRAGRLHRDRQGHGRHGAVDILGPDGGKIAILSASPGRRQPERLDRGVRGGPQGPEYANIELLETVYGNDQSEKSYKQAQALIDKYPDLKLIMAPTSVGIVAAAKAVQDEGLCDTVKVSGLGVPAEMVEYTLNGCAPEFALWSFVDLGYLTYYVSYLLATGAIQGVDGRVVQRPAGSAARLHHHRGPDPP